MADFSEVVTKALENVIETKVQERCQGLIAENTRLFVEKQELGNRIQNLETENRALTESNLAVKIENRALRETLYSVRDLMRVLDDEFGDLERNVRDIESSIGELQRELEEEDD